MKKVINLKADSVGVDAGMIMFCCDNYIQNLPYKQRKDYLSGKAFKNGLSYRFKVPKGKYKVTYKIQDSWNGPITKHYPLTITSGFLVVSDPCYLIAEGHEDWQKWLNETDYGRKVDSDSIFIEEGMGGDGCYTIDIVLQPVKSVK